MDTQTARVHNYQGSIAISIFTATLFLISSLSMALPAYHPAQLIVASSLLRGRLDLGTAIEFIDGGGYNHVSRFNQDTLHFDLAWYKERVYSPNGPLPALLIVPLIPIIEHFGLWYAANSGFFILFNIVNFFLLVRLGSIFVKLNTALWMSFAFIFGSSYIGVTCFGMGSYLNHILATTLIVAVLLEYYMRRRYWMIGLLMGLTFAARIPASLGILFFIMTTTHDTFVVDALKVRWNGLKLFLKRMSALLTPFFALITLHAVYNYLRFDSIFEVGYRYQVGVPMGYPLTTVYGLWHLIYVPQNLYLLFLKMPNLVQSASGLLTFPYLVPDNDGMSIFLTTPFLFLLLFVRKKGMTTVAFAMTSLAIFIALMLLFSPGNRQYGYRFSIDFLVYLWMMIVIGLSRNDFQLSQPMKWLIAISALVNLYFVAVTSTLGYQIFL